MAADEKYEYPVRFDLFELDLRTCQLRRAGVVVDLPRQAVKVLSLLIARPSELVTRKEVKDALWPGEAHGDFDSRLNFVVKRLREGLGDSAEQPRYIQTVRNAGYIFIAPLRSGAVFEPSAVLTQVSNPSRRGLRLGISALVGAVAAVAVMLGFLVLHQRRTASATLASLASQLHLSNLGGIDGLPSIDSVSGILPQEKQKIVIRGRGFGLHVPYSHTDSPYLAIRNQTADWAAGRIIPQNYDEVMVDVESWDNNEIIIAGFSGDYGERGWLLHAGDQLEIAVWNPETGTGPALYHVAVASIEAKR